MVRNLVWFVASSRSQSSMRVHSVSRHGDNDRRPGDWGRGEPGGGSARTSSIRARGGSDNRCKPGAGLVACRAMSMQADPSAALRVLIADGKGARSGEITETVASLGHEVIAHEAGLAEIGPATARVKPDVAVVIVGDSSERSLRML